METVTCPSCSEENPAKFKLCGFCGTPLAPVPETVLCPSCGEENPSKFRLCGFCGTALGGRCDGGARGRVRRPRRAPVAAPALPPTEVRKFVTLVFTDLKDSTALTASIDAEAMNEIKARYFETMAGEIERHGGHVEKNIGDAIMAVFGRIRASEDDALRGVRAAADMVSKLTELNEEFERYYGVRLTVRTGVNTGEVVASTDEHATMNLATGDAVNVAARLEQNAPANEVLIGEMTYALVRDFVDAERVELMLKGKSEPVPAYRLIAVRAADRGCRPRGRAVRRARVRDGHPGRRVRPGGRAANGADRHGHRRRGRRQVAAHRRLPPSHEHIGRRSFAAAASRTATGSRSGR